MDRVDATRLTALIEEMCPAQRIGDDTPLVWAKLLAGVSLADALEAVAALGMKQDFVSPKDIIAEVKRVRDGRLVGIDDYRAAFPGQPDDVRAELEWWRSVRARIADGEAHDRVFDMPVLVARDLPAIEGAFRRVPRRD